MVHAQVCNNVQFFIAVYLLTYLLTYLFTYLLTYLFLTTTVYTHTRTERSPGKYQKEVTEVVSIKIQYWLLSSVQYVQQHIHIP